MIDFKKKTFEAMKNQNHFIKFVDDVLVSTEEVTVLNRADILGEAYDLPFLSIDADFQTTKNTQLLERYLTDEYIANNKRSVAYTRTRADILRHFRSYFIRNNENLHAYKDVPVQSREYNNICYYLYQGISQISERYSNSKDKFKVLNVIKSKLFYKIALELPEYIEQADLREQSEILGDFLMSREGDLDLEVHVTVEKVNKNTIITLFRYDYDKPISLGDILSYGTGFAYNELRDSEMGTPVVVGLIDNEIPKLVDLQGNGNISIVGESGSSEFAYALAMNIILTKHYEDYQFVVCTYKDYPNWRMFSRTPHVLGYHTETDTFLDVVENVAKISEARLKIAQRNKAKNYTELKEFLGEHKAEVMLVVDGCSQILESIARTDTHTKAKYKKLWKLLDFIAETSKLTGVSILGVTQRSTRGLYPESIHENSVIKILFNQYSENDVNTLFPMDISKLGVSVNHNNVICCYEKDMQYAITAVLGGLDDKQTLSIIRVVAFEWVRKSMFEKDIKEQPFGLDLNKAYNRDVIASDSLAKIESGKLLPAW